MRTIIRQLSEDTLLSKACEITFYGIALMGMQYFFYERITGLNVMVATSFLAIVALFKIIWPIEYLRRHLGWQIFAVLMCCAFSWYLIYTAENTRAGWYRQNVLKGRIFGLVENSPAYVILSDSDANITATSNNIELLTGYTPKELIGQSTTVLMRDGPAAKHQIAYDKAISMLRDPHSQNQGWMLQGLITVAIKHKNGNLVPVKAYTGGIRWSTDIQFKGDIDVFAIFVPVDAKDALKGKTNLRNTSGREFQTAPPAPSVHTTVQIPTSVPVDIPKRDTSLDIVYPK